MTQEQIDKGRIAIAERLPHVCGCDEEGTWRWSWPRTDPFNPHMDLNAMHEAEKMLIYSKRKAFRYELQKIMSRGMDGICLIAMEECIHATAPQRFEAMLCVLTPERENAR